MQANPPAKKIKLITIFQIYFSGGHNGFADGWILPEAMNYHCRGTIIKHYCFSLHRPKHQARFTHGQTLREEVKDRKVYLSNNSIPPLWQVLENVWTIEPNRPPEKFTVWVTTHSPPLSRVLFPHDRRYYMSLCRSPFRTSTLLSKRDPLCWDPWYFWKHCVLEIINNPTFSLKCQSFDFLYAIL